MRRPLAIYIDSDRGNLEPSEDMYRSAEPANIISALDMKHICYEERARYGHFYD